MGRNANHKNTKMAVKVFILSFFMLFSGLIITTDIPKKNEVYAEQSQESAGFAIPAGEAYWTSLEGQEDTSAIEESASVVETMEVHFIDIGQGDSILIKCDDHAMLIDAGDNEHGVDLQSYLENQGVHHLDAVVWTHLDPDHIGGADTVTSNFNIDAVYMTNKISKSQSFRDLKAAMEEKNYVKIIPEIGSSFLLGQATVTFLGPLAEYSDNNNSSLVCMVQFGDNRFLFTGDAEEEAEYDMVHADIDWSADVMKAGHHGSFSSTSAEILEAVQPEFVVASCGVNNRYGHPSLQVLNNVKERGIAFFRTDEQGSIVAISNGKDIRWNVEPFELENKCQK